MGLFDFLKKKEFEEIKQLKSHLERYKPIVDIEAEVGSQKRSLDQIISSVETLHITKLHVKLN
jgi:hypothetical protein